jgi:hypothetical protein
MVPKRNVRNSCALFSRLARILTFGGPFALTMCGQGALENKTRAETGALDVRIFRHFQAFAIVRREFVSITKSGRKCEWKRIKSEQFP